MRPHAARHSLAGGSSGELGLAGNARAHVGAGHGHLGDHTGLPILIVAAHGWASRGILVAAEARVSGSLRRSGGNRRGGYRKSVGMEGAMRARMLYADPGAHGAHPEEACDSLYMEGPGVRRCLKLPGAACVANSPGPWRWVYLGRPIYRREAIWLW